MTLIPSDLKHTPIKCVYSMELSKIFDLINDKRIVLEDAYEALQIYIQYGIT